MAEPQTEELSANALEAKRRWERSVEVKAKKAKEEKAHARARRRRRFNMMVPTYIRFRRRFEQLRQHEAELNPADRGIVSERGLRTAWVLLRGYQVRAIAEGSRTFRTSKPKTCDMMGKRGRRRETRTVQRTLRRLEWMEYCDARHHHKRLMRDRERDCLDITMSFGSPALRAAPPRLTTARGGGASASNADNCVQDQARPPPAAGSAAPDGAGLGRPAAPAGTKEGRSQGPVKGSGGSAAAQAARRDDHGRAGTQRARGGPLAPDPWPGQEVEWCEAQLALPFTARSAANPNTVSLKAELLRYRYERRRDGR